MTRISISPDKAALNHQAAALVADTVNAAVAARGWATLSLSGGSTPKALYELLATPEWKGRIPWKSVQIFWGDERFVPPDDKESNYRMVKEALLSKVEIPAGNVHRVMTETGPPEQVAEAYERTIREVFRTPRGGVPVFDLVLLGLGENGHTASLFPHTALLHENQRLFAAEFIAEVNMYRLSMTVPLLNAGRSKVFLVAGEGKAAVVHDVVEGPYRPEELPSQLIKPEPGELLWLLDRAAASKLTKAA